MADPKLKNSSVTIRYGATDGYRSEAMFSCKQGARVVPPETPLLDAIEELARLCELFGYGEQAATRVTEARARVVAWRAAAGEAKR